jgi:quercetin dioxygenase-like cupin family protein
MFTKGSSAKFSPALPGISRATLAYGTKTMFTEFRLAKGSVLPKHSHPHEQTGYLLSGKLKLTIGGETFDVMPGDCWCIEGGVEHFAEVPEDSVAIEVFSPVRQDYLPKP